MRYLKLGLLLSIILSHSALIGQTADNVFESFDFQCHCVIKDIGPAAILSLDNNAAIALGLQKGKTVSEISIKGARPTESQLWLMHEWHLLEKVEKKYFTAFPVIKDKTSRELRLFTKEVATAMLNDNRAAFQALADTLRYMKRNKSAFALIWAYVLNDLVWRGFDTLAFMQPHSADTQITHWSGEFWAIRPKRIFHCNSQDFCKDETTLRLVWREGSRSVMADIWNKPRYMRAFLEDYNKAGKVSDEDAKTQYTEYQVIDKDGYPKLPLIDEKGQNVLHQLSLSLANGLGKSFLSLAKLAQMKEKYQFRDQKQALIVIYHEVSWDLLDLLHKEKLAMKPIVLLTPGRAAPADIGSLFLLIRK